MTSLKWEQYKTVGIVGGNGSGKSTLLSLIGGVIMPCLEAVNIRGSVSMLLELGAGFHNDLSGRDNIILNGILQGKTKREMKEMMEEIIDFANIGDFIDCPISQYSSGMKARLAFAVATAIKPEILLIDEILAVGDIDFAQKCEKRIKSLLNNNTTLILVSHNYNDIQNFCERTIKIENGIIVSDCSTKAFCCSDG
ncbi:MAG: ABC transporter ATP-binding protein [Lentisphaerae bacterium]|nr:ABC transporter ATP-binding protein [Lentisphaerota bacterium]MCP4100484.1 ABC transporter ATP-binding protein [Lentisphaerota bacterium]